MRATRREEISNYLIYIKKEKEIFTMRKVKRIKNVLCVLLATIISLVSMTTVKADGEVAPYEDMENATLNAYNNLRISKRVESPTFHNVMCLTRKVDVR